MRAGEDEPDPIVYPFSGNWEASQVFVSTLSLCYEMAVRRSERPVLRLPPCFPDMMSLLSSRSGMVVA